MHHGTMINLHTIGLYSEVLVHTVLCCSAVWARESFREVAALHSDH